LIKIEIYFEIIFFFFLKKKKKKKKKKNFFFFFKKKKKKKLTNELKTLKSKYMTYIVNIFNNEDVYYLIYINLYNIN